MSSEEQKLANRRARQKRYDDKNREQKRARGRAYYHENKAKMSAYSEKWAKENREKRRETARRFYQKNRESCIARSVAYHQRNRESINAYSREWRTESPKFGQWRVRNRQKIREQNKARYDRYRASFREFQNKFGSRSPRRVAIYFKWEIADRTCYICGLSLQIADLHIDHVYPVSKGGTNDIRNLMPAHARCNMKKSDRLDYPIARPDLIIATIHIQAVERNITQIKMETGQQ